MMIHPEEIRLLIQQRRAPDYWRVKRGSVALAISNVWLTCILNPLVGMWLGVAFLWFTHFYSSDHLNFTYPFVYSAMYALMGVIFSCIRANIARSSALVFLPEGFLHFNNITKPLLPSEQVWQAFWYPSIANLHLHLSIWRGNYLEVYFHDGKMKKWSPKAYFGRRDRILQDVLTAYTAYGILNLPQAEQNTGGVYSEMFVSQE